MAVILFSNCKHQLVVCSKIITEPKKTASVSSKDALPAGRQELDSDMSSSLLAQASFKGNPVRKNGEDVIKEYD